MGRAGRHALEFSSESLRAGQSSLGASRCVSALLAAGVSLDPVLDPDPSAARAVAAQMAPATNTIASTPSAEPSPILRFLASTHITSFRASSGLTSLHQDWRSRLRTG
jgi:hypothetical protein